MNGCCVRGCGWISARVYSIPLGDIKGLEGREYVVRVVHIDRD